MRNPNTIGRIVRCLNAPRTLTEVCARTGLMSSEVQEGLYWMCRNRLIVLRRVLGFAGVYENNAETKVAWTRVLKSEFPRARAVKSSVTNEASEASVVRQARLASEASLSDHSDKTLSMQSAHAPSQRCAPTRVNTCTRSRSENTPFEAEMRDPQFHVKAGSVFDALNLPVTSQDVADAPILFAAYWLKRQAYESRWVFILPKWKEADEYTREQFCKAAASARAVSVTPKTYVVAQFWWFETKNRGARGKKGWVRLIPQPQHLFGEGAESRVATYKTEKQGDGIRQDTLETAVKARGFDREARKLKGLAKWMRVEASAVLLAVPEEFTKAFLKKKGVWKQVETKWLAVHED